MAHTSHSTSQLHMATKFHFLSVNMVSLCTLLCASFMLDLLGLMLAFMASIVLLLLLETAVRMDRLVSSELSLLMAPIGWFSLFNSHFDDSSASVSFVLVKPGVVCVAGVVVGATVVVVDASELISALDKLALVDASRDGLSGEITTEAICVYTVRCEFANDLSAG